MQSVKSEWEGESETRKIYLVWKWNYAGMGELAKTEARQILGGICDSVEFSSYASRWFPFLKGAVQSNVCGCLLA